MDYKERRSISSRFWGNENLVLLLLGFILLLGGISGIAVILWKM